MQSTLTRTQQLLTAATTALAFGHVQLALLGASLSHLSEVNIPVFTQPQSAAAHRFTYGSVETYDQFAKIQVIETFARKILANSVDMDPKALDAVNKRFWDLI